MIRTMKFKRVLALMVSFMMVLSSAVATFASGDTSGHWAESDINYLVSKNYVKGDDNGDIRPDENITRAEFVTVVNRIFGYTQKASSNFADISASAWYYDQFLTAKAHGYLSGDENGNANPDNLITRAEVAVIVSRIMNLSTANQPSFTDAADFPEWAVNAIAALSEKGLISGYADGSFGANALITRAESFVIFARIVREQTDDDNSGANNSGNIVGPGYGGGTGSSGGSSGGGSTVVENNKVTITRANAETGLNWTSVKNTLKYQISITHEKTGIEHIYYATENKFSVKDIQDEILPALEDLSAKETYIVKVKALRNSPYSDTPYSTPATLTFQFDSIAQVTDVSIESANESATEQFYLTWSPVENASGYVVTIKKGETVYYTDTTTNTNIDITQIIAQTGIDAKLVAEIQTLSDAIIDSEVLSTEVTLPDFGGGDGSGEAPYLIYNARHFENIKKDVSKNFVVKRDIVLPDSYAPISNFEGTLKGDVDGDRAVITVNINMPDALNVGLFGETGKCTIENLQVEGKIVAKAYAGGIVGYSGDTTVINCVNNASVTSLNNSGTNSCIGGIIGYVNGNSVIKDCINFGRIESTLGRNTAGIVGYATNSPSLVIENCENNGDIVAYDNNTGGIVGYMNLGLITKCRNNGTVTTTKGNVGGIAGANYDRLEQCYNTGAVTGGQDTTGGIAGTHSGGTMVGAWLNNNYNTGTVSHAGIVGAAGGNNASKVIKFNYNVGQTAAGKEAFSTVPSDSVLESNYFLDETEAANEYATGMTSSKMQVLENFIGFDSEIWTINETEGYPYPTLRNNPHKAPAVIVVPLQAPSNIQVIEKGSQITLQFDGDSRAQKHKIEVVFGDAISTFETANAEQQSVDISSALTQQGTYTIQITSLGDGVNYRDSLSTAIWYDMVDPDIVTAPTNLEILWGGETGTEDKYLFTFTPGRNAESHDITILKEGAEVPVVISDVSDSSVDLTEYILGPDNALVGKYSITVTAKKGDSTMDSLPISVNSAFAGTQEQDDVIYNQIGCLRHLKNIAADGKYIVIKDITDPVTEPLAAFSGVLLGDTSDGAQHKKIAINIVSPDTTVNRNDGLFTELRSATVKNIGITGSLESGGNSSTDDNKGGYTGGLAGLAEGTTLVENCFTEATITKGNIASGYMGVGGLLGGTESDCMMRNCFNTGSITSGTDNTGGLIGYGRGIVENCFNEGSIYGTSTSGSVGGVIGSSYESRVANCYNIGEIRCDSSHAGGITGTKATSNSMVSNCFNTGTVYAKISNAGGILGREYNSKNGKVIMENCYNAGAISVETSKNTAAGLVGALGHTAAGRANLLDIKQSYTVTDENMGAVGVLNHKEHELDLKNVYYVSDAAESLDEKLAGVKIGTEAMKAALPEGFDSSVWRYLSNYEYPQLQSLKHVPAQGDGPVEPDLDISSATPENVKISANAADVYTVTFDEVEGADSYAISIQKEEAEASVTLDAYTNSLDITEAVLGTDFADAGKYTVTVTAKNNSYTSLPSNTVGIDSRFGGGDGTELTPYEIFNMRHFKNIDLNREANYLQMEDLVIEDGYTPVCPDYNNRFNGTYRGKQDLDNDIKYRTVQFNNVTAPGQYFGLFGVIGENGIVEFIGTTGSVNSTANYVGGISYQNYGVIQNCYSSADLTTTASYCGGITGDNRGVIENCYTTGNISATNYAAGIAAITANGNQNVRISKCYATGDMTVSSNYACGIIGGVGMSSGASTNLKVVIEDCYFTGMINGGGRSGGIIGLSADCSRQGKVEVVLQRNFVTNTGYANKIYGYGLNGTYKDEKTFKADNAENFYLTGGTASAYNRGTGLSAEEFKTLIDRNFGTEEVPKILFPSSTWELKAGFDFPQLISNPHVSE